MAESVKLDSLDLVRGLAALLVVAGHLRAYVFKSYGEVSQISVTLKAFYFATGLGHEAVIASCLATRCHRGFRATAML
jgi:peptidoglycan/LPS O-acetylase OafA/YrhL